MSDGSQNTEPEATMGAAVMASFLRLMQMREAIASVSLSHPESCVCDVCKAAQGDDDALARVLAGVCDA